MIRIITSVMLMMTTMTIDEDNNWRPKSGPGSIYRKGTIFIFSEDDFGVDTLKLTLNLKLSSLRNKNNHLT